MNGAVHSLSDEKLLKVNTTKNAKLFRLKSLGRLRVSLFESLYSLYSRLSIRLYSSLYLSLY